MNKIHKIILTSIGLSCEKAFNYVKEFLSNTNHTVSIIVTASKGKKQDKYVLLAVQQFQQLGITNIHLVDLEYDETVSDDTTILYVAGGNTFHLMYFAQKSAFQKTITDLLDKGGLYIGVSAGSIIMGKTIAGASILGDENTIALKDLNGFNYVNNTIFPHADETIQQQVKELGIYENVLYIENDEVISIDL
jgi:dipeptidase E